MSDYEIRYCRLDEEDKLQRFIDTHWKKGHVLGTNKKLLDYQHKNLEENRYNFVVAYNKLSQDFDVILGFIPHRQYDTDAKNKDIWLAIWKKNEVQLPKGLGTKLLDFLEENYQPTSIGSIGINDLIEQLYLKRNWKSGVLSLWYFLKPSNLISFEKLEVLESNYYQNSFHKTDKYYENRYSNHPFYNYNIFQGVIYRKIETEKGSCLRIVDFKRSYYLDEFYLNHLLTKENADYIDCLNFGIPDEQFEKMGFKRRSNQMIIPQWFEPLDTGIKDIKFAYKSEGDYLIMKGDSDQDRPNIL